MSIYEIGFCVLGYLSGSVLYARIMARLFSAEGMIEESSDHNPGAFNAFTYGGPLCGFCTLILDVLKGFLPVFLYLHYISEPSVMGMALMAASPVLGHVFPVFYQFNGGKGIAVTFGVMMGMLPCSDMLLLFAGAFIILSTFIKVESHYYRTLAAYMGTLLCLILFRAQISVVIGFTIICCAVWLKMHMSTEEKGERKVSFLWMH